MEENQSSNFHVQYYCTICNTKPDQISHHKAHLKTQKHIFKKKCFEQCVNMTVFHFHNTLNMDKKEVIQMFEDDTNFKYINGDKESISKFVEWRQNREELLKNEYPNSIIPQPKLQSDNPEFISDWLKIIIESNETVILKPKKTIAYNKNIVQTEKYKNFKEQFANQSIEYLINKAIDFPTEFDIAVILYKLNCEKYSFKSFTGNVWIDKSDSTISSNIVFSNLRNQISTNLKNIFEEVNKNLPLDSKQKKNCCSIIQQLVTTKIKNNIMNEVKELFFNN